MHPQAGVAVTALPLASVQHEQPHQVNRLVILHCKCSVNVSQQQQQQLLYLSLVCNSHLQLHTNHVLLSLLRVMLRPTAKVNTTFS